ncbi:MAG TPA: hypothetical protein VF263_26050 [Longimicrobiaceae bacterium]
MNTTADPTWSGVEELDRAEMEATEGGNFVVGVLASLTAAVIWDASQNWEEFKKEVAAGYND